MNVFFLIALIFLAFVGSKIFGKFCSNLVVGGSASSYTLYFMVTGIIACIFFLISGGFKLAINTPTAIYSLIYALIAAASVVGLAAYKLANVSTVTIITSTTSIIGTSALGVILFKENISFSTVLRIAIMLVAVFFTFLSKNKETTTNRNINYNNKKRFFLLFVVLLVVLITNCAATIVTKFYAMDTSVVDENSFFFFTNVFLIALSLIVFIIDGLINREHFKTAIKMLDPKKSFALVGNTVCSNISSLVGILLIALIDVSVYSPVTSALGIISGVVASLLFREKLGIFSYLAALIACVAVII